MPKKYILNVGLTSKVFFINIVTCHVFILFIQKKCILNTHSTCTCLNVDAMRKLKLRSSVRVRKTYKPPSISFILMKSRNFKETAEEVKKVNSMFKASCLNFIYDWKGFKKTWVLTWEYILQDLHPFDYFFLVGRLSVSQVKKEFTCVMFFGLWIKQL